MNNFGKGVCPQCNERQWSVADNNYLALFGHCWACDKRAWQAGKLTLEEFERREKKSVETDE